MSSLIPRLLLIAGILLFPFRLLSNDKSNKADGLTYVAFPGQPAPTNALLTDLVHEARWDNGDLHLDSGESAILRFDKVDDQVTAKGTVTRYRVFAESAPENKVYAWAIWKADEGQKIELEDIYVNKRGLLMTRRPRPEEESSLQVPGTEFYIAPEAGSAEPIRYSLFSRDAQVQFYGTLVPHPVAAEDQGCRLEVRIAQPHAAAVLFVADGFPLDSKIPLVLESEGEFTHVIMETDAAGRSIVAAFPSVPGKRHGNLRATAEGPSCLPSVRLPWGSEAPPAQTKP